MKAWQVSRHGSPSEVLVEVDIPPPEPGPDEIVVRVRAVGVNFPDALMCLGTHQLRMEPPYVLGSEVCGDVVACPDGSLAEGTRVLGISGPPHGGYAQYALVRAVSAFATPPALDDAEAAVLCVAYHTAWSALHRLARIEPGEVLLVHAAAGGVGSATVQLGKAAGATVIGVAGGRTKCEYARALGADHVIDRLATSVADAVNDLTRGRGADVVFDPVGGDAYDQSTKCIAFEGRIVLVGFAGGRIQQVRLNHALVKNYSILGLHWGRYLDLRPDLVRAAGEQLMQLAADGVVRPPVSIRAHFADVPFCIDAVHRGEVMGRAAVIIAGAH
jgi:NADPH2:quinone reductase